MIESISVLAGLASCFKEDLSLIYSYTYAAPSALCLRIQIALFRARDSISTEFFNHKQINE